MMARQDFGGDARGAERPPRLLLAARSGGLGIWVLGWGIAQVLRVHLLLDACVHVDACVICVWCVCTCIFVYVCVCMCTPACVRLRVRVGVGVGIGIGIGICICICLGICICICIYELPLLTGSFPLCNRVLAFCCCCCSCCCCCCCCCSCCCCCCFCCCCWSYGSRRLRTCGCTKKLRLSVQLFKWLNENVTNLVFFSLDGNKFGKRDVKKQVVFLWLKDIDNIY